jgi:signal peptidase I
MKFKETWKKFWFLLWKDNSLKGWIFSVVFLFVFIKLVFFPLLSLATGTSLPLAIVESCSMYHSGNLLSDYSLWYNNNSLKYGLRGINKTEFSEFPMHNGFNKGDILLITHADSKKLEIGDIIVFNAGQKNPIIHRIVSLTEKSDGSRVFSTMGDNNSGQLSIEKGITEEQIIGKAQIRMAPYLGWVKLVFFDWKKSDVEQGFCN